MADCIWSLIAQVCYGSDDDVAGLITWLASPEAAFITGTNLKVDGGKRAWSLSPHRKRFKGVTTSVLRWQVVSQA